MDTYSNYRNIYEQYHGPIPKDSDGRSYEIHHRDGDRNNNSIDNLQCVSLQEHYEIHKSQGDWWACMMIASRMTMAPDDIITLAQNNNQKMLENGTHPFLNREMHQRRVKSQFESGVHPFQDKEGQKRRAIERVKRGTHNFLGPNSPSQREWTCPHCNKSGKNAGMYTLWHGDNCRSLVNKKHMPY